MQSVAPSATAVNNFPYNLKCARTSASNVRVRAFAATSEAAFGRPCREAARLLQAPEADDNFPPLRMRVRRPRAEEARRLCVRVFGRRIEGTNSGCAKWISRRRCRRRPAAASCRNRVREELGRAGTDWCRVTRTCTELAFGGSRLVRAARGVP